MKSKLLFLLALLPCYLYAQQTNNSGNASLPRTFSSISLGMTYDAVLDALQQDANFIFRGRPDVSLLDPIDRTIIEVRGAGFVYRGFFSFYNDQLYSITIVLNQGWLDYFTVWNTLKDKYDMPTDINPARSLWDDGITQLSLEQPATLKYLDIATFEQLLGRSNTDRSALDRSRDRFLEGL